MTDLVPRGHRLRNTVLHITGLGIVFVGVGVGLSTVIELATDGPDSAALIAGTILFLVGGGLLWRSTELGPIRTTTIFAAVAGTWIAVSILGAVPYLLAGTMSRPGTSLLVEWGDALFESVSGFTCTGSTVIADLPEPGGPSRIGRGMLFWRQLTQWYGGMGIVLLVLAVLPALGVRAASIMAAESPGPGGADRLVPRISETAKRLWVLYCGITAAMALAFLLAGMSLYDAVAHAVATAATGGFSPYGQSIGAFDSITIEIVVIVAMIAGGTNFVLHYRALTKDRLAHVRDPEFRWYVGFLAVIAVLVVVPLWVDSGGEASAIRGGVFNAASLVSSTGYGNAQGAGSAGDFTTWIPSAQVALLAAMVVGGMSGSTAGGIKVGRFRILGTQARNAMREERHPRGVFPLKTGAVVVPNRVVDAITGFIVLYLAAVAVGLIIITAFGSDLTTALGGVVGTMGNMGPSFNQAGPTATFLDGFDAPSRLVLVALMLIGRLEIYAVVLLFAAPLEFTKRVSVRPRLGR